VFRDIESICEFTGAHLLHAQVSSAATPITIFYRFMNFSEIKLMASAETRVGYMRSVRKISWIFSCVFLFV
jgi:hypothetical protein